MSLDKKTIITVVATLVIGLVAGWWMGGSVEPSGEAAHEHASAGEIWTCSMHPQIRQHEPGQCPICGMDLIPLENAMSEGLDPAAISMSPTAMQLANVSTAIVEGGNGAGKTLRLNGKIQADERLIYTQASHIPGRIEKLLINFTGEYVRKGQTVAYLYSPDLVNAQKELFEAMKLKDAQPQLMEAARKKLSNWKLTDRQIDEIISSGEVKETFPLLADVSGYVASKKVNLGDHVPQGAAIYEIADFSSLWVLFDVYEADMKWVKKGDKVDFTVSAFPGEHFNGTVTFVDPAIDPKTRVAKARVEVKNKSLRLKPEMFVSGTLQGGLPEGPSVVVVPKSAVLWTGKRSLVYVKVVGEQAVSFVMREVTLGPALGDSYVIESGLRAGEEIAVNGAFSIDAAAQLAGKPSMMSPAADGKVAAFNHDHMVMLTSNETTGQEVSAAIPAAFVAQWTGYVKAYLKLKNELVNDSPSGAAKAAKEASNELKKVDMKLLTDHDMHMTWMKVLKPIQENTDLIGNSADITVQRDAFVRLSEAVIEAVGLFGIQGLTVYQQHCPMANSSKGADWLSLESEIKNPYYGASMLSCGSVEKTFNPIK